MDEELFSAGYLAAVAQASGEGGYDASIAGGGGVDDNVD
jgi:hypothetical protein